MVTGETEDLGEMTTYPLDADTFGFRYFDDEEDKSKEYLTQYKQIGRWFSQIATAERPKVIKQWREMGTQTDYEWLSDNFTSKLFDDEFTQIFEDLTEGTNDRK